MPNEDLIMESFSKLNDSRIYFLGYFLNFVNEQKKKKDNSKNVDNSYLDFIFCVNCQTSTE